MPSGTLVSYHLPSHRQEFVSTETPADGSCLLYAVMAALLVPCLKQSDDFEQMFLLILPTVPLYERCRIKAILQRANGEIKSAVFSYNHIKELINEQLRPRIAQYIEEHADHYQSFFTEDDKPLLEYTRDLRYATTWCGAVELSALAQMLQININVYTGFSSPLNQLSSTIGCDAAHTHSINLHFTCWQNSPDIAPNHYRPLILKKFFPRANVISAQAQAAMQQALKDSVGCLSKAQSPLILPSCTLL